MPERLIDSFYLRPRDNVGSMQGIHQWVNVKKGRCAYAIIKYRTGRCIFALQPGDEKGPGERLPLWLVMA